jgi:TatD DNase family protein
MGYTRRSPQPASVAFNPAHHEPTLFPAHEYAPIEDFMVKGHYLRLRRDPTFEEILEAVGDPSRYKEVVFCGYGEPTLRLDMLKQVAHWLKEKGVCVRLNTDGLGNLVHKRNILPELAKLIDIVSVSLNAQDPEAYAKICPSKHGEKAYPAVKEFIRGAKQYIPKVIATAVTYPGVNVERCQEIVEKELGVQFRARQYNEVG